MRFQLCNATFYCAFESLLLACNAVGDGFLVVVQFGEKFAIVLNNVLRYLCKEGFTNLAVLDISGTALSCAKKRLGNLAQNVEWYESDITQFDAPHQFSLWHDRAVFHFLANKSDRNNYVEALINALRPGGHAIIAAFAIGGPEKCSGLDIVQYDAAKLVAELGGDFELVEERSEVHITPADKEQTFVYFRFAKMPKN